MSMKTATVGYGEIYIEKRGREASGLKPRDELLVIISKEKIEIIRIPRLEDILNKTPLVEIEDKEIEIISQEFPQQVYRRQQA